MQKQNSHIHHKSNSDEDLLVYGSKSRCGTKYSKNTTNLSMPKIHTSRNQKIQHQNNNSLDYNATKITSIISNTRPGNKNIVTKIPQTTKQSILSICEANLESNQESYEPDKGIMKMKSGFTMKRQDRGLKNITEQVKNIIVSEKASTSSGCSQIIYDIMIAEIKSNQDKAKNIIPPKADDRTEINIKLRVNDAQKILIAANIFQETNKQISLSKGLFSSEVRKYKLFGLKTQQNRIKYKKIELCGMIKKYAILKNIMARNKIIPSEKKIAMPFLMVHRKNHNTSKMWLEQLENDKKALILCTGDVVMHGYMKVQLSSKMVQTMPNFAFKTYIKEAVQKLSDHMGFTPSFLEEESPVLQDLMTMGKVAS